MVFRRGEVVANLKKSGGSSLLLCLWFLVQPQAVLCAQAAESRLGNLIITEARARPTPPGISVGAVYFSITNAGSKADRLLSVSTPVAGRVELHESRNMHGVVEMREVTSVECPPGATVRATPGGLHVMLLGLAAPLAAGTELSMSLQFRDAGVLTLKVPVV
jgi:copper(I)-binding protein